MKNLDIVNHFVNTGHDKTSKYDDIQVAKAKKRCRLLVNLI